MPLIALPKVADWSLDTGLETVQNIGIRLADIYTKLLLHCEGADGSQVFTDSSPVPKTITAYGDAQIDTAYAKFGIASGLFDGGGDYLTIPASADWDFGSGNFTIDFWFRPIDANRYALFASSTDYWLGIDYHYNGTQNINIYASSNGTSWNLITADVGGNGIGTASLTLNAWNHVAFVRNGNNWMTFINGIKNIDITVIGSVVTKNEAKRIGLWGNGSYALRGSLDEFRIVKGLAVWTANFTPPNVPYVYTGYSNSSPVAESPWISISQNTLDATTPISISEMAIAALQGISSTGNVKYQYALNNGTYNGTWLTQAQLVTALQGQTITNHTNSLRLKAQLNSNGTQAADITITSYLRATASGLLVHPGYKGGYR
jgi:hypothetical protein